MALFSFENLVPPQLPYPIRGGIIRGVRTAVAFVLAGLAASIADGSLLGVIKVLPAEYAPAATLALTAALAGIDKWLREKGLVDQAAEDNAHLPLTDPVTPVPPVVIDPNDPPPLPTSDGGATGGPEPSAPDDPIVFDDPID